MFGMVIVSLTVSIVFMSCVESSVPQGCRVIIENCGEQPGGITIGKATATTKQVQ